MTIKERYEHVLGRFAEEMPSPTTELEFRNNYELIVSVILSAQCTDKRVNMITPALFRAFPTPQSMADAEEFEVYEYIKSCSYPNNKSKLLVGMARKLMADFGGEVPGDIDSLLTLPGVGRKTANVVLAVAYHQSAMPVDTHVFRVSERIGLTTRSKSPLQTEKALMKHIPADIVADAHHWLILHGRYVCKARKPLCGECCIAEWCRYYSKSKSSVDK